MKSNEILLKAAEVLNSGGIIAFPTETVFGLGIVFDNESTYERLNKIKNRSDEKPYTLMLADPSEIEKYAIIDEKAKKLIDAFMPGPITLLMQTKRSVPLWVTHGSEKIGIRISSDEQIRALIRLTGKPLLVPSANKANMRPALDSATAKNIFGSEVNFYIEGISGSKKPSTIVDICDTIKVIREGEISPEAINKILEEKIMNKIAIGSDHAGVDHKNKLKDYLELRGYTVVDVGTDTHDSVNYPDFGKAVGQKVASGECKYGVVICSTGIGISIAANKVRGVRCGLAYDDEVARLIKAHNNANVIAFGQSRMSYEDCERRLEIFLMTPFDGGRHETRVSMLDKIDEDGNYAC